MTSIPHGRVEAAAGAVAAVLLIVLNPAAPTWLAYLLFWLPLLAAVAVAAFRRRRSGADDTWPIRLRITWMDVLVGAFFGLALRLVMIVLEALTVGQVTSSASFFLVDRDTLWFATAILAPALIAPLVEELYFRGLVLPTIGATWLGIVASAAIFSAVHLVYGFNPITAASTFVVGLVLGAVAVRTGRLGAGIVAHVVYNASLVAISEFGGLAVFGV